MKGGDKNSRWIWGIALLVSFFGIPILADFLLERNKPELWENEYWAGPALWHSVQTELFLTATEIPEFNLVYRPFREAIEKLESHVSKTDYFVGPPAFVIHESVSDDVPKITIQSVDATGYSVFHDIMSQSGLAYHIDDQRQIIIGPPKALSRWMEEGWFKLDSDSELAGFDRTGKRDLLPELEASGIEFSEGSEVYFDPEKELVWARNFPKQLLLIHEALDPPDLTFKPTIKDRLSRIWARLTSPFRQPDPFGP